MAIGTLYREKNVEDVFDGKCASRRGNTKGLAPWRPI